jgi:lipopolysaccharide transport system permease protein
MSKADKIIPRLRVESSVSELGFPDLSKTRPGASENSKGFSSMVVDLRSLSKASDLIWAWTSRTIKGRYQQSLLGWLWAIVQPAATVAIFAFVFSRIVRVDTGSTPYVLYAYVAFVPWNLTSSALTDMTTSLVQNMSLVTKIYFPREVIPISLMLARVIDLIVASVLVVVLIYYYSVEINLISWLVLPVIIAIQLCLIMGLGLLLAALNVFSRDIEPLVKLGIQLWFYASPIIYPITLVPEPLRPYYYINPMAGILEAYRDVIIHGTLPGSYLYPSIGISLFIFVLGYWFFKRVEPQFADIV